jgi:hypothetical protein
LAGSLWIAEELGATLQTDSETSFVITALSIRRKSATWNVFLDRAYNRRNEHLHCGWHGQLSEQLRGELDHAVFVTGQSLEMFSTLKAKYDRSWGKAQDEKSKKAATWFPATARGLQRCRTSVYRIVAMLSWMATKPGCFASALLAASALLSAVTCVVCSKEPSRFACFARVVLGEWSQNSRHRMSFDFSTIGTLYSGIVALPSRNLRCGNVQHRTAPAIRVDHLSSYAELPAMPPYALCFFTKTITPRRTLLCLILKAFAFHFSLNLLSLAIDDCSTSFYQIKDLIVIIGIACEVSWF